MDVLIFLIRLLQFNLGVPGAWTEQLRTQGPALNARVFEMMIVSRLNSALWLARAEQST